MESIYDKDLKESGKKIQMLSNKINNLKKSLDKEFHLRELLIAEKYNLPVYMKPKWQRLTHKFFINLGGKNG